MEVDMEAEQVAQQEGAQEGAKEAAPPAPPNPDLEAYAQRWATVQADPQDFNTWTSLLTIAERLDDMEKVRAAYDAFLAEYPLCYGYWKKYADAEVRHQSTDMAAHVYERGVAATPYSADLWAHYAAFKKGLPDASPDDVRSIYERGLAYVATDYNSHTLWDKYLSFEQEKGSTLHIASLYSRVLACPVRDLDRYYSSFKSYIQPLAAGQIVMTHDYDVIRARLETERAEEQAKAAAKAAEEAKAKAEAEAKAKAAGEGAMATSAEGGADVKAEAADGEGGAGDTAPAEVKQEPEAAAAADAAAAEAAPTANGDAEMTEVKPEAAAAAAVDAAATVKADPDAAASDAAADGAAADAEAPKAPQPIVITDEDVKQVWVKQHEELYEATKAEQGRRKPFEEAARRPYFHIKPLDGVQLFNWIRYLDYIEGRGDHTATVTVFERCLVACANYPEFWQRYVRYLERTDSASAKAALERAVQGFCKRRPEMHLFAAHYDEQHGDVEGARGRFRHLLTNVAPRLLEAVTAAANFERRQGNMKAACSYLSELTNEEKAREGSRIYPFLAIHYAHFLRSHGGDLAEARKVCMPRAGSVEWGDL
ncbi:hypothetical protein GPECTOR_4g1005 [Gonium pectorale]|uniref:Uncharacterized protein n=1 Tax=Gonium pectorale TaxID=33097 RepID=A0A150GXA9_GONPE|nr:hypothetical protein GPECTOR_4g1005 [Gonium pectorale]|eukprot:KXZ54454.1 hypothetical protein GPECTOR_4g1005 [Gonium pectorale]